MNEIYILIGALIIVLIIVVLQFWKCVYENGRLEELVKQKDEKIEQLEISRDIHMRDRD